MSEVEIDYSIFHKSEYIFEKDAEEYDVLVSAFNESDRVKKLFEDLPAKEKYWVLFPDYGIGIEQFPSDGQLIECPSVDEAEQLARVFDEISGISGDISKLSLAIDITGFPRPQLAFLLLYLSKSVETVDLFYSEPIQYVKKEKTNFSTGAISEVRQIRGFEGSHSPETTGDLLIVGSGYDEKMIKSVCNHKAHALKYQVVGFPSLRPDMYQENIYRASSAAEELGDMAFVRPILAPANDPFQTAQKLSGRIRELREAGGITNIYLSPLSTKPQTVGFVLMYLFELAGKVPASIIFPFSNGYSSETTKGLHSVIKYRVEYSLVLGISGQ